MTLRRDETTPSLPLDDAIVHKALIYQRLLFGLLNHTVNITANEVRLMKTKKNLAPINLGDVTAYRQTHQNVGCARLSQPDLNAAQIPTNPCRHVGKPIETIPSSQMSGQGRQCTDTVEKVGNCHGPQGLIRSGH